MATILDTLVIELGLDPTKLNKGQQQALAAFKKAQEEALKSGKRIEDAAERVTQYLGKMRNYAAGFAAAAFGANGIIQFVQQVTSSNAALGRSAPILGTTVEKLSVWRNAVKLAGGTAEGLQQTVAGLVSSFARFGITGDVPESARWFQGLGLTAAETTGKLKPFEKVLFEISDKVSKMDPVFGAEWLRGIGIDESIIPFMLKGPAAMKAWVDEMEKVNKVTKEAAEKSAELERRWIALSESAKGIGINIIEFFTPALQKIIGVFGHYLGGIGENINKIKNSGNKDFDPSSPPPAEASGSGDALRQKRGAGSKSLAVYALASSLQNSIPNLKEFTAFDDAYHKGRNSRHNEGLALDFTVTDPSKYAETASAVRRKVAEMGIAGAYVRDEKNNPSPGSSGPHIHVSFPNKDAASTFLKSTGAAGAAAISNATVSDGGATNSTVINGGVNVTMHGGDSEDIVRNLGPHIQRKGIASNAQTGGN